MSQVSEPLYQFVKGQGWVIETYPTLVFTRGKQTIRLTQRKPVDGERFHNLRRSRYRNYNPLEEVKEHLLLSTDDIGAEWIYFKKSWAEQSNENVVIEIL